MGPEYAGVVRVVTDLSQKAERRLDGKVERWTEKQVHFVSYAQRAVRQALYFERLLEADADEALLKHIRRSVEELLEGAPPIPSDPPREQESALRYTGAKEPFVALAQRWTRLKTDCRAADDVGKLRALEKDLCAFLSASAADSWFIHLTYTRLPAIVRALGQHLGFAVGAAIALAVLLGVEAVSSLFRNRWLYGVLAFVFAVLPGIALLIEGRRERKRRTPRWDVGGRVAREVLPTLIEPDAWVPWHPRGQHLGRKIYFGLAYKILLYLLTWLALWIVVRLLVSVFSFDPPLLTVYLIAVMLAGVAFAGAAIDYVDIHSQAPVRGILLSGVLVVGLAIWFSDNTFWLLLWPILWSALVLFWVWRVRQARATVAVVVIIAGVVAAHLTTTSRIDAGRWKDRTDSAPMALIDPSEWPAGDTSDAPVVVMAASGGGSRAAIMVAHTLQRLRAEHPRIAENLQAISSVSGGSLATAAYVVRQLHASGRDTAGLPSCDESLLDAMGQDFLYPTLLGVIPGFGGRAESIQRAWQKCPVGLDALQLSRLAQIWRSRNVRARGTVPPFAVPIFNSVSLDRHAVAITPLAGKFFWQGLDEFARSPASQVRGRLGALSSTWVYYRSGIYHVTDLGERIDPSLSEAVRASANFPFGFPLVEVETTRPLWYSPRTEELDSGTTKVVRLTDGGALSNSGLWPLLPLLLNKKDAIKPRGVLLIIVDASRMPTVGATDRQLGLLQTLFDKAPKSERSHFQMLEELGQVYGDCFEIVQLAIDPLERNNIHTTWALDGHSRALLDTLFDESWRSVTNRLDTAFTSLRGCKGTPRSMRARRVPVD
ncbi:MAG: hypothetical protein WC700_09915 [Gemmatimonadaceae bacterium]|jgi:hypothetical protein